jgi:hypothetical protein
MKFKGIFFYAETVVLLCRQVIDYPKRKPTENPNPTKDNVSKLMKKLR